MSTTSFRAVALGNRFATQFAPAPSSICMKSSYAAKAQLFQSQQRFQHTLKQSILTASKSISTTQSSSLLSKTQSRNASTTTPASTASSPETTTTPAPLTWEQFFQLRKTRRRYGLASSIISTAGSTAIGIQVLGAQDLDALGAQVMGLDPIVVMGLATAAFGALGWLLGPVVGNGVWNAVYRKYRGGFEVKEKEFYARIRRYRVDPSSNSFSNPVPDFYGEKISSVAGYRNWLKDQRAYNRKRNRNFV